MEKPGKPGFFSPRAGRHALIGTRALRLYTCRLKTRPRCCRVLILRGRKTVRTQSAILYKAPAPCLLLCIAVFLVRMLFIRTRNTVGAHARASPLDRKSTRLNSSHLG